VRELHRHFYSSVCVVYVCVVYACVCARVRERERERATESVCITENERASA